MDLKTNNEMMLSSIQSLNEMRPLQTFNTLFIIPTTYIFAFTSYKHFLNIKSYRTSNNIKNNIMFYDFVSLMKKAQLNESQVIFKQWYKPCKI